MSKYLKLFIFNAVFFSFSALFVSAQNSESVNSDKEEEKDEDEEAIKTLTTPSLVPTAELSGIESNDLVKFLRNPNRGSLSIEAGGVISASGVSASAKNAIGSSGVASAEIISLGSSNIKSLASKLSGTAAQQATQFKTLVNVVDAYSNVEADSSKVGRRAIANGADISAIVGSTINTVTTDHLETLSKLDTSHMTTFASDGISNIDNFATRVDVTSAMVGESLGTISSTNLGALVENLHASLDGDSLTALKSLEKSHMTTLVGSGDKKIDLTSSFDAKVLKSSVKKFATKAEITVTFAKKSGGSNLKGVDLSSIAKQIHANLDDDHITALQNLSIEHMDAMMPEESELSSGLDVSHIAHIATKAEVVVEFAKASAGSTILNDDGTINFGTSFTATNMKAFVTTVHTHITEDMTKSIALFDPEHISTLVPTGGTMDQSELEHFGTKAQVGATYFTEGMSEEARKAMAESVAGKVHTLDKEMTTAFKALADHSADLDFDDIVGNITLDKIHHAGAKAKKTSTFISGGHSVEELKAMADDLENHAEHLETLALISQSELVDTFAGVDIGTANSERNQHNVSNVHYAGMKPSDARNQTDAEAKTIHNASDEDKKAIKEGKKSHNQVVSENDNSGSGTDTKILSDDTDINTAATEVQTDAKGKNNTYTNALATATNGFPKALESAVKVAELILTDRVINNDNDLADDLNVGILSGNGYNTELIRILAKYGALGSKGGALADAVLGSDFTAFNKSINLSAKVQPGVSYYQQFLSTLGARAMGPDKTSNHVHINTTMVSTSNIKLSPGANVTFNASAEIDASDVLPKGDRRIAIIGAAKDMTIKGNLNIKNSNTEENGVMVLGAADDFYLRSEYGSIDADYNDPALVSITNEGANLAIGSEDTMRLVNVSISTGGNLAIGTLNELHIGLSDGHKSYLSVGNGGQNSDPDNIYLYANELIQINGMEITGRVDDVYMEAVTINLRNVTFPHTSEVTLRSRNGTIGFSNTPTPTPGSVNMYNVKHGSDLLSGSSFNGVPGNYATNKVLPNGTPAVQVKKF